ncbi:MAG: hypothetical protein OXC31_27535, partial [Spirochaetaceae bacterium]|nr:hypothetical protein [Spirochaetaceae bacterium]
ELLIGLLSTAAARDARADWSRFDSDKILVVLEETDAADGTWRGRAVSGGKHPQEVHLRYDSGQGLTVETNEG